MLAPKREEKTTNGWKPKMVLPKNWLSPWCPKFSTIEMYKITVYTHIYICLDPWESSMIPRLQTTACFGRKKHDP